MYIDSIAQNSSVVSGVTQIRYGNGVGAVRLCFVVFVPYALPLLSALMVSGGPIPASTDRLLVFVCFEQPVLSREVSFCVGFGLFAFMVPLCRYHNRSKHLLDFQVCPCARPA